MLIKELHNASLLFFGEAMLKLHTLFFVLLWTTFLVADEPSRTWTSRQGLTLQGVMIGVEDGMVLIKQPNGDMFKAKLDALSQADVDYVKAVSFGPDLQD